MQRTTRNELDEPYDIRLFEPADRRGYLDLYRTVFGDTSDAWFDWKYADNPYTDHVAIAVALADGDVVGAKSQMGFEVSHSGRRFVALQPGDTMVHPDHRRRGLYSRMTDLVTAVYGEREPALLFNYPNEKTLAGSLKHGWDIVGPATTRYRIHDPAALAGVDAGSLDGLVETTGRTLARGLLGLWRLGATGPEDVSVRRHRTVPVETLADLYRRDVPDRLHVVRDETYLEWRFGNPNWEYTAYTAARDGEPVCGAVVGRGTADGTEQASLTEVLPLSRDTDTDAARAMLARIVDDYRDVDIVVASDHAFADSTLSDFGFLSDTSPPLSWVASPDVLVANSLDDGLAQSDVATLGAWTLGLGDRDTR